MVKKLFLLLAVFLVFFFIIHNSPKLLLRTSSEYDEGVYLTTFLLVDKGNTLYQKTFFSQPPGFFYLTYPGFELFGKTLEASRLTIFIWSLVGLFAILWLTYEIGNIFIGILTIAILYSIPLYFNEILTFHADSIPLALSTLAIASMFRFKNRYKMFWFGLASMFFSLGILTKLDISAVPPLLLIFIYACRQRKISFRKALLFLFFSLLILLLMFIVSILPFGGLMPFYNNVILLRLQALKNETYSFSTFFTYLINSKFLFFIILTSAVFSLHKLLRVKDKKNQLPFFAIALWSMANTLILMRYYPLFLHHLVLLTVPFSLLFSYLFIFCSKRGSFSNLLKIIILILITYNLVVTIRSPLSNYKNYRDDSLLKKGAEIVNKNTGYNDYIVADDSLLYAVSNRLPPPWLSDLSSVRLKSENLSSNTFKQELVSYKPKLIFSLSGRLNGIKGLNEILNKTNYRILQTINTNSKVFILK